MSAVLHAQGTSASVYSAGGLAYNALANTWMSTSSGFSTSQGRVTYRAAGVISKLWCNLSTNTLNNTTTLRLRINGTNGNSVISIAAATSGLFEDSSNTDNIAAADTIDCTFDLTASGSGSCTLRTSSHLFSATTNTVTQMSCSGLRTFGGTTTAYYPYGGTIEGANTTEARAEQYFGKAGTVSKWGIRVTGNGSSSAQTVNSRLNTAAGAGTISIPISTSGVFEDLTNSDTIAPGDVGCFELAFTNVSVSMDVTEVWAEFTSTADCGVVFWAKPASGMTVNAFNRYINPGGSLATVSAAETDVRTKTNMGFDASHLSVYLSSNSINQVMTLTLRANAANTTLVCSITASTSGRFTDTANAPTISTGDILTYEVVSAGSGTSSWRTISMSATYASTPPPTTAIRDIIGKGMIPWAR